MKVLFLLLSLSLVLTGSKLPTEDPKTVFATKMKSAGSGTLPELTLFMASTFLGTPYVANTLEGNAVEQLVCRFDALDCTTLVDVSLALAIARQNNMSYEEFLLVMSKLRYAGGAIDGYASRQHYFLSWLSENQKTGLLKDVTHSLGGVPYPKAINFMSTHASLYKGITSDEVLERIKKSEQKLKNQTFHYIPKAAVRAIENKLKDGDIIGITSTIEGLDCNHQGVIKLKNNRAYLLHASTTAHKVILSEQPLTDYLNSVKRHSGVIVVRPRDKANL